jgi:hypothetical protein
MNATKHCLYLIVFALLCTSCGTSKYNQEMNCANPSVANSKYGLVLLRTIFFKKNSELLQFGKDEFSVKLLSEGNRASIYAKESSEEIGVLTHYGYQIGGNGVAYCNIKPKNFVISKTDYGFLGKNDEYIVKPEWFYSLRMLPEGEYFLSNIAFDFYSRGFSDSRHLYKIFDNKHQSPLTFVVKAGKINYLGDIYFSSPELKHGNLLSRDSYKAGIAIKNENIKAKAFMSKYYPDIDFPFAEN